MSVTPKTPEIRKVSLLDSARSWAIYGRSGTGKTTLSATFPKPILLLDVKDQGTDSIADEQDVFVVQIEDWDDLEAIYYKLKKKNDYATIVIDTITQVQQLALEEVMFKKRKQAGRVGDWGTMTKREWGEAAGKLKDWIVNFRELGVEVVFLAQEKVTSGSEDDDIPDSSLTPQIGPLLMPSVASTLNASVSVIAQTFIRVKTVVKEVKGKKERKDKISYCLWVGPDAIRTSKLRKPKSINPPTFIENPSYDDVISIIKGE